MRVDFKLNGTRFIREFEDPEGNLVVVLPYGSNVGVCRDNGTVYWLAAGCDRVSDEMLLELGWVHPAYRAAVGR